MDVLIDREGPRVARLGRLCSPFGQVMSLASRRARVEDDDASPYARLEPGPVRAMRGRTRGAPAARRGAYDPEQVP
jgi:hypothetical protein